MISEGRKEERRVVGLSCPARAAPTWYLSRWASVLRCFAKLLRESGQRVWERESVELNTRVPSSHHIYPQRALGLAGS